MTSSPRCTFRGCPVRFRAGDDRACRDHDGDQARDTISKRAAELGIVMQAAPGQATPEDSRNTGR
jgi:hypothetical protein